MLITVPVEELRSGDVLQPDSDETTLDMVRDAMSVPTRTERTNTFLKLQQQAKRVERIHSIGRIYAHITMGTYAIVSRRKGTLVSVDRPEQNEPQRGSGDVSEATERAMVRDEYADKPADYVDEGGVGKRNRLRDLRPGETIRFLDEPEPFGYVQSQFRKLGTVEHAGVYKIQIWGENSAHTKWLNVHPDDLAKIQEILELRETEENCPHRVYLAGVCTLCGKRES